MRLNHRSLRAIRLAKGFSTGELARRCEVVHTTVSNLEAARPGHRCSWELLKRLARELDVDVLALTAPAEDPTPANWPAGKPRRGGTRTVQ
jgi:transcriptional regulator with XRE-family HTH domain